MREVPDCLSRRNKVLNELIQEIRTAMPLSTGGKPPELSYMDLGPEDWASPIAGPPPHPIREKGSTTSNSATNEPVPNNDVSTKLMCDFWKVLDDDCDLKEEITHRMCKDTCKARCKKAGKRPEYNPPDCCKPSFSGKEDASLRKALGDARTAASYEQKCHEKVGELQIIQKDLLRQINSLEEKSKQETGLLKEADCMWSCMEGSYKNRLADAKENCELLQSQLNEIEASLNKWKKTQNDVETELKCVNKTCQETNIKIIQKENDVKIMQIEIEGFHKRIDTNEKDLIAAKASYALKKEASDARVVKILKEMETFRKQYLEDCKRNEEKEKQGEASVKEVREDLQKLCRVLLQKKIANEDLKAETEALVNEVELLKKACITCRNRCNKREKNVMEEVKRMDKEIAKFNIKCIRCHKETSSADMTGFCFECPRCLNARECLNEGDHCETDHAQDCICTRIKRKFLDNVFDNMYTVLERQVCTCPGKEIADCILNCLKRSRNGKLNDETKVIVQDFILSTVRQNLNLTIVGGAVKTRCEMDEETYQQLMLCLKDVVVTEPQKTEKGIVVNRKLPCTRWTHSIECHCPSGPKTCPCLKSAARKSTSPSTCGPEFSSRPAEEKREDPNVRFCPLPDSAKCGVDCKLLDQPSAKSWKRPPCTGGTCNFSSNMRAAQCVLGPEALANVRSHASKALKELTPNADPLAARITTSIERISPSTVRISTSNIRIIPSVHTYPPDKRKYSGNLPVYEGEEPSNSTDKADEPSNSTDRAVFFVTMPAYSTNKLTYSIKKPVYYVNKPAYPVDEKTYPADKFMFALEEPAYQVVEPAYLADEERVHRPGGRAYPADIYPIDKPMYPTEERVYRPEGRAHPADEPVYPADEPAYLPEERIYRPNGRFYRRYEPVYPADEPVYPAEDRFYRHDGRAYPAYEPIYPADEPVYPAEEFVYRPDRRVYPAYDPMYPADESAYPAEERVHRPDARAYEPLADEPAYMTEERTYVSDESKQKADRHPQKLDGRSLDKSMLESRAHATDDRAPKYDRHPQKPDRNFQKSDGRVYPAEDHAYRSNRRTQKADRHPQKTNKRMLDESVPESQENTIDERAQKVDRYSQKIDGRSLDKSMPESRSTHMTDERAQKDDRHPQKSDRHSQKSNGCAYQAEENTYRSNGRTQKADGHLRKTDRRTLDERAPESHENTIDERAQKVDRHPQKQDERSLDKSLPESRAYTTDERTPRNDRYPQKPDRNFQKSDGRAYPAEDHAYRPNGRTQKADGHLRKTEGRTLDERVPESRENTIDERAQKVDRHPQKQDGRTLDKSMPESRAYAIDERAPKNDRRLHKSDRHFQKSEGRAYPAEENAYRPNGRTQKADGHPQKTDRCSLDESAPESV